MLYMYIGELFCSSHISIYVSVYTCKYSFRYFEKQIELAEVLKLPMFLHCRNSATDLVTILRANRDRICGGVVSITI